MSLKAVPFVALLALTAFGCREAPQPKSDAGPAVAAYVTPPQVRSARLEGGVFALSGAAPAKSRVRLATPAGQAVFAEADAQGRWRLRLPMATSPQVFGVSAAAGERSIQAEGYLLLSPDGRAALLRAGAGAVRLDLPGRPAIAALDFDAEGGAAVSGLAPAGSAIVLRIDGRHVTEARADQAGRFQIPLPSPITAGSRRLTVVGDGFSLEVPAEVSPAEPLADGPFRTRPVGTALRADWMTPGGGVQSTLLFG